MTLRHCCVLCVLIVVILFGGVRTAEAQCTATVSPTSVSVSSVGSTSAVSVTTGTNCFWMATSSVSWITVTSGATGAGIGQVNYTVAANTIAAVRVGTLTVAGQTVTITQATGSCSSTVTPTSVSVPSIASAYTLSVVSGTSCSWTAVSNVSWITVTAGASGSAIGSVSFNVAATTTARTGTLTVAGQTVTVTQAAASCVYTVTPTSVSAPSTGNTFSLSVTSGTSCSWTAVSNVSWITVTAGASGSAIGSVTFTVAATTTPRTGTLTVAGRTVTVTEDAPTPPLSPTNLRIVRGTE